MADDNFKSSNNTKPWHTREWKEMRKQRIGDECAQCGSTKEPFVLQHFSHDRPDPIDKNQVVWNLMMERNRIPEKPTVQRFACPQCSKLSLTKRKTLKPTWRCIPCHHEFDDPILVEKTVSKTTQPTDYFKWRDEILFPAFHRFKEENADLVQQHIDDADAEYEIERKASYEHYISGVGTATFCKKCAFLWDKKEMKLCGQCKTNYHPFHFYKCFSCLPESRKKEISEYKEFERTMDEIHGRY